MSGRTLGVQGDDADVGEVHVLLVDDEQDLAEVTALHLEQRKDSFQVTISTAGEDAISTFENSDVDCVVSDYEMPGIDGLDLLRELKQRDSATPFILYTGRGSEEIASDAISAGVTDYLQKRATSDQYDMLTNRIENAVARNRSERAREETEHQYRTLVEASPHGIIVHRGEEIVYANDAIIELLGVDDRTEIYGTDPLEYVHPDDRDRVASRMQQTFESREKSDWLEWKLPTKDGSVRYVESRGTPITYGGTPAVQVVVEDVTDRHRHEKRLEALNDATRELLTAEGPDAVATTALEVVAEVFDEPYAAIWSYWPDTGELVPLAATDAATERVSDGDTDTSEPRATETHVEMQVFETGEPRVVTHYAARDDAITTAFETVFMFPLADHGLLTVASVEPRAFDESERDLLRILGRSVVAALDRLST